MTLAELRESFVVWKKTHPLRLWRIKNKWTQGDVADAMDLTCQSIRMYEAGRYRPQPEVLRRLATLMRRPHRKLNEDWTRWLSKRPLPRK